MIGRILFWLVKPDADIERIAWEHFKDVLVIFLALSVVVGVLLAVRRYKRSVALFKIQSPDDVFREFTPRLALLQSLWAFPIMIILGIGFYALSFGSSWSSFILEGLSMGLLSAIIAILLSYLVVEKGPSMTPKKYRYRNLIRG